jgi:hypothetical protein
MWWVVIAIILISVGFSIAALVITTRPIRVLHNNQGAAPAGTFTIQNKEERPFTLYTYDVDKFSDYDRIATKHGRPMAEIHVPAKGTTRRIAPGVTLTLDLFSRNHPLSFEVTNGDVYDIRHADSRRTGRHVVVKHTD